MSEIEELLDDVVCAAKEEVVAIEFGAMPRWRDTDEARAAVVAHVEAKDARIQALEDTLRLVLSEAVADDGGRRVLPFKTIAAICGYLESLEVRE
jgi:hypothetical protein